MSICKFCKGEGTYTKDDKLYECSCSIAKRTIEQLPVYIKNGTYTRNHYRLGFLKHPDKLIYFKSYRTDFISIMKCLCLCHPFKWIKIINENDIRNVYTGSLSKASKSKDYEGIVFNNLQELVDPPQLLVIELNTLTNKNKAAPGALLESVKSRVDYGKPLWVWSDVNKPFGQDSFTYTEAVSEIFSTFYNITVPLINKDGLKFDTMVEDLNETEKSPVIESASMQPKKIMQPKETVKSREDDIELPDSVSIYGQGTSNQKKFKR